MDEDIWRPFFGENTCRMGINHGWEINHERLEKHEMGMRNVECRMRVIRYTKDAKQAQRATKKNKKG
jgi:hypothetical protein